jgi:hypothetical protein
MEIFYHGTHRLFDHFSLDHQGEGEGKAKYGCGIYITSSFATAARYAAKAGKRQGVDTYYVYTIEVPDITPTNHLFSCRPVAEDVASHIESALGERVPDEAKLKGKFFRKYVANLITGQRTTVKKMTSRADIEAEKAVSSFFDANGLVYFAWPQAQTKPDGITNRTVFNVENIRILKVEQVEVDANNNLVEPSPIEIKR